jgi:hypothetical protein
LNTYFSDKFLKIYSGIKYNTGTIKGLMLKQIHNGVNTTLLKIVRYRLLQCVRKAQGGGGKDRHNDNDNEILKRTTRIWVLLLTPKKPLVLLCNKGFTILLLLGLPSFNFLINKGKGLTTAARQYQYLKRKLLAKYRGERSLSPASRVAVIGIKDSKMCSPLQTVLVDGE